MNTSGEHGDLPLPMLITGLAGVPGYSAMEYFSARYPGQVIGVRRPNLWTLKGPGIVGCDLSDADAVNALWNKHRFRSVLNGIGSCRLKSCELDPAMARRVNFDTTENVVRCAAKHDARTVHLSIDLVYAGRDNGGYVESDPTDPVTVYGAVMADTERFVMSEIDGAAVLRISLPMGVSFNGHAGAIDWIESRFIARKPATLYFDEVRTPAYTDCLNALFDHVFRSQLAGLFHAGGPRRLSLYEIAQVINFVGGYDPGLLMGCPRSEAGPMPPRAGNVAMDSTRLEAALRSADQPQLFGWPHDPSLVPTDRRWHYGDRKAIVTGRDSIARLLYRPGLLADLSS